MLLANWNMWSPCLWRMSSVWPMICHQLYFTVLTCFIARILIHLVFLNFEFSILSPAKNLYICCSFLEPSLPSFHLFYNVILFPVTSSETFSSFLSQSLFFIYVHKFAFTKFLRLYIYILHLMTTSWSCLPSHKLLMRLPSKTDLSHIINSWWSIICSTNLWNLGVKFTAASLSALAACWFWNETSLYW